MTMNNAKRRIAMRPSLADRILDSLNEVDSLLIKNGFIEASDKMIDVKFAALMALDEAEFVKSNIIDLNSYRTTKMAMISTSG